ncbi:MAG TPA: glycogen/starch/alpha-glucan phosphorylase, partial [Vicinamibacteria bacterium]
EGDRYLHLADFGSYAAAQRRAEAEYADADRWTTKALRNVARMGPFSSDRSVSEYAREIWGLKVP